jgi:hypothetical protein
MSENNGLKNRIAYSSAMEKDLYARLKEYSNQTKIPMSKLLDMAVKMFLDSVS